MIVRIGAFISNFHLIDSFTKQMYEFCLYEIYFLRRKIR